VAAPPEPLARIPISSASGQTNQEKTMNEDPLISELRKTVTEQREKIVAQCNTILDLERHNKELREAVAALLAPDPPPSQASQKKEGRLG
jgi:hypothetical protein